MSPSAIRLRLGLTQDIQGLSYQLLTIELATRDRIITPADLNGLDLPPGIDTTGGVILSGRAPIWLYGYLVHELHPTAWVACYDPRLGAVVVSTHSHQTHIGQVLPLSLGMGQPRLCPALMVVGPPDSGKTVFSHALFRTLLPNYPDVFLQRAQWDGEGNWILELPPTATDDDREVFKRAYKGRLTTNFFPYHADAILQLRRQKQLVIVDVGGKVQDAKMAILEACSHYLIISAGNDQVKKWHEFCRDRGNLRSLAVIKSTLDETEVVHQREPFLEMTCGPWVQGERDGVPDVLLAEVRSQIIDSS